MKRGISMVKLCIKKEVALEMDKKKILLGALATQEDVIYTPVQVQKLLFLIDRKIGNNIGGPFFKFKPYACLLYTSPSPRDLSTSRMPSSA